MENWELVRLRRVACAHTNLPIYHFTNVPTLSARNSGVIFDWLSWPGLHRPGLAVQGMAGLLVSIIACGCLVVGRM